jgi:putative effector of murein hydrolase LrgA (UPF0299 family)
MSSGRNGSPPGQPRLKGPPIMVFIVAAFLLLGLLVGTAAHIPVPATLAAAAVIAAWLLTFVVRERKHRRQGS